MPIGPVIVFCVLLALGLAAVTVLVVRLKLRGARREPPPRPAAKPTIEDELQAIIDAREQTPR